MVCVSFPGNKTSTKNPYSSQPAAATATTTIPAPTDLAPNENTQCGKYYQVQGKKRMFPNLSLNMFFAYIIDHILTIYR
jgi:hypothetical protein